MQTMLRKGGDESPCCRNSLQRDSKWIAGSGSVLAKCPRRWVLQQRMQLRRRLQLQWPVQMAKIN